MEQRRSVDVPPIEKKGQKKMTGQQYPKLPTRKPGTTKQPRVGILASLFFWQRGGGYLKDFLVSPPRQQQFEGGKRHPFLPREPYDSVVYSSRAPRLPLLRRSIVFALFHRVYSHEVSLFRIK